MMPFIIDMSNIDPDDNEGLTNVFTYAELLKAKNKCKCECSNDIKDFKQTTCKKFLQTDLRLCYDFYQCEVNVLVVNIIGKICPSNTYLMSREGISNLARKLSQSRFCGDQQAIIWFHEVDPATVNVLDLPICPDIEQLPGITDEDCIGDPEGEPIFTLERFRELQADSRFLIIPWDGNDYDATKIYVKVKEHILTGKLSDNKNVYVIKEHPERGFQWPRTHELTQSVTVDTDVISTLAKQQDELRLEVRRLNSILTKEREHNIALIKSLIDFFSFLYYRP